MNQKLPAVPPEWSWHHRALRAVRAALLREHDEHEAAARTPHERAADLVDIANEVSEQGTLLAELSHEEAQLADVEHALERIRLGTYGVCEATGRPIPAARLRALPWARFSHEAAEQQERAKRSAAGK